MKRRLGVRMDFIQIIKYALPVELNLESRIIQLNQRKLIAFNGLIEELFGLLMKKSLMIGIWKNN